MTVDSRATVGMILSFGGGRRGTQARQYKSWPAGLHTGEGQEGCGNCHRTLQFVTRQEARPREFRLRSGSAVGDYYRRCRGWRQAVGAAADLAHVLRGHQVLDLAAVLPDDNFIFRVAVPELVCALRRPMV